MEEIRIKKKDTPVWPWILGALAVIIALVLIFAVGGDDNEDRVAVTDTTDTVGEEWRERTGDEDLEVPREVSAYVEYVRETNASADAGLHHEYTSEGIMKLSSALDALVSETGTTDGNVDNQRQQLRNNATFIQQDPHSAAHADSIRSAFVVASNIIASVQKEHFPNLGNEAESVRSAANNVDPATLTLNQLDDVEAFFEQSASALESMTRNMESTAQQRNRN